jgi:hypothetical protein
VGSNEQDTQAVGAVRRMFEKRITKMNIIKRVAASGLALAALTTAASAADIQTRACGGHKSASCQDIAIFGQIQSDDGEKFVKLVADKGITESAVYLNSTGGNLAAAIQIGREIKRLGFATFVDNDWVCASGCAYIWLAGSIRYYEDRAKVGFHAPYIKLDGKSKRSGMPALVASTGASAVVGAYFAELGLSEKAIYYLTVTPPNQMFWLSVETAQKLDIKIVNATEYLKKKKAEAEKAAAKKKDESRYQTVDIEMQKRIVPLLPNGQCPGDSLIEPFQRNYCVRDAKSANLE